MNGVSARRPRVLVLSDPPFWASSYGLTVAAIAPHLAKRYDLAFHAWGWNGLDPAAHGLRSEIYPCPGSYHGAEVLGQVLLASDPDVVLYHGDPHVAAGPLAEALASCPVPVVGWFPLDGTGLSPGWPAMLRRLAGVVATSAFAQGELESGAGITVRLARLGVDQRAFRPLTADVRARMRREFFPFMHQRFVVGWVGRNAPRKNPQAALAGFAAWLDADGPPDALLYMHTQDQDPAGTSLLAIVERDFPQLAGRLVLPGPFDLRHGRPQAELATLMACCDVGLNTSLGEGWGMPITEWMAAGVPVVAPAIAGTGEQLGAQERGLGLSTTMLYQGPVQQGVVAPQDVASTLSAVYRDPEAARQRARTARAWTKGLTWEATAAALALALDAGLGSSGCDESP